jgi:hypothetical protein
MHFIDPETGEAFDKPNDCGTDVHGTDVVGEDENGMWWGTDRAAWLLGDPPVRKAYLVRVDGFLASEPWTGFFIGRRGVERRAVSYARRRAVKDVMTSEQKKITLE